MNLRSVLVSAGFFVVPALATFVGGILGLAVVTAMIIGALLAQRAGLVAFILLLSGPLLLSTFSIGGLPLDNYTTVIGLFYGVVAILGGAFSFSRYAAFPLVLSMSVALSGLLNSADLLAWFSPAIRMLGIAALACLAATLPRKRVVGLLVGTLGLAAVSLLLQPVIGYPDPVIVSEPLPVIRYGGLVGHPNFSAYVLGMGFILVVAAGRLSVARAAIAIALLVGALSTGSLTALLVLVPVLALALVRRMGRLIASAVVGAVLVSLFGGVLLSRVGEARAAGSRFDSLSWRFGQWEAVLGLDRSWFSGVGWDNTASLVSSGLPPHNAYIQVWVELGAIGTILSGVALLACLVWTARSSMVLLSIWIYAVIASLTDPVLVYPATLTTLMAISGYVGVAGARRSVQVEQLKAVESGVRSIENRPR